MNFEEIRDTYYETTARASDVARQLTFAGFAAIWVFRTGSEGVSVPALMIPAAIAFAFALICDALQYGVGAFLWRRLVDRADRATRDSNREYEVPGSINDWPRGFFAAKLWSVGFGYLWYIGALIALGLQGKL